MAFWIDGQTIQGWWDKKPGDTQCIGHAGDNNLLSVNSTFTYIKTLHNVSHFLCQSNFIAIPPSPYFSII